METIFIITICFNNGDKTRFAVQTIEHAQKCVEQNTKFTHVKNVIVEQSVIYTR